MDTDPSKDTRQEQLNASGPTPRALDRYKLRLKRLAASIDSLGILLHVPFVNSRHSFLRRLRGKMSLLEIGVFDKPSLEFLRQNHITIDYADWLSKEELEARAKLLKHHDRDPENIPDIKYILKNGFDQINARYDCVVSHHCVEHQPDLIRHFIDVFSVLNSKGSYLFSLPDKNRCFDRYIPQSTIVDALEAFYLKRTTPSFKSILEHRCFTSQGVLDRTNPYGCRNPRLTERFTAAFTEYCEEDYVDVHCWQFTPGSFKRLYSQIVALGLLPRFRNPRVYPGWSEFYVSIDM